MLRTARRRITAVVLGAAALMPAAAGVVAATPAGAATSAAAPGCRVVYTAPGQWPGGFTANVAVTNLGDAIDGWRLTWTFPAGQRVTHAWNAEITSSGSAVTATNVGHNATLRAGATTRFGFNGAWTGSNPDPVSFSLNGTVCTGPSGGENAVAATAAMQPGWNLGNSLDAVGADETAWGNPRITPELLDNVRAQGFKSIRIPVTWSAQQGGAPDYTINAAYLDRVREVVDWALADGFYVMINIHHDSWQWINAMPADRSNVVARYNAIWTQLASAFRSHPSKLTFESVNEPQFTGDADPTLLHELNTSFHRIVRGSGGGNATRLLVLPTLHTSSDQQHLDDLADTFAELDDPHLIATVHYYGYWPFSVNVAGGYRFDATAQQDVIGMTTRVYDTFVARGIPVIIGEYGLLGFDRHTGTIEQGEKLKFFEFFGHHARSRQLTTMLWDNGQHFGRTSFTWSDPELWGQIRSSFTTRSGTASSDLVFSDRASAVSARTVTLHLNGTAFRGLRHGATELARGRDYTVSGDQLTLSAGLISRLSGDRAYGVNASLTAHFSSGVPWRLDLITYDAPEQSDVTGTSSAYAIPTEFRGDRLATMEAVYADGSNAGPHNWTSYKEYDVTFKPDYPADTVTLTPAFFAEVRDDAPVTLRFHFWSGTVTTYTITKSGSTVTGAAAVPFSAHK